MIKEYRKTATIKAEQFDGSEEMMNKYHLTERVWSSGIHEYSIKTKEGLMELWIGDWISTGVEGEHWAIADEIFKKTYEEVG